MRSKRKVFPDNENSKHRSYCGQRGEREESAGGREEKVIAQTEHVRPGGPWKGLSFCPACNGNP